MAFKLISNEKAYIAARNYSEQFATISQEDYADFVKFIGPIKSAEAKELANKFIGTMLQFYLNKVEGVDAKNPFDKNGLIRKQEISYTGLSQELRVRVGNPINPKYKNLVNGTSVDKYKIRKPEVEEVIYGFNADYQNLITVSLYQLRTAFTSEMGVSRLVAGIMKSFASKYIEWEKGYDAQIIDELISKVNEEVEQVIEIDVDETTKDGLKNTLEEIVLAVNTCAEAQHIEVTEAFNLQHFPNSVENDQMLLLLPAGLKPSLKVRLLQNAFNKDELNLDIEPMVVPNFGGLVPTQDGTLATRVYPVYDADGAVIDGAFTTDEEGLTPYEGKVQYYDPHADVIGVIVQKGIIKNDYENAYSVWGELDKPGEYITYWANRPEIGFHYDPYYNCIVIKKKVNQ